MEDNKNKTKVDLMYDDLYEQGYLEKDRDTFNKFFYAPGEQGYKNRKALYDDLHEQGYLESPTYEDFARGIGLHAVGNAQDGASSNGAAAVSGVVTGRPDLVESLDQYGEGLQSQSAPAAGNVANAAAPSSRGGGAGRSWSDGENVVKKPDVKKPQLVRQEDLYVDEKGNPAIGGYTKDDAKAIEHSELFYPLMRNDSINVRNTEAFRKGWLTAPQYEKNRKYNEAQAAGYKAQGEKFKNLTDQQLVQAMREEEKKLDGSTSPEALQASMNVTYIETLMAAREWGLGDVAGLKANPHMVEYHMARDRYNKNGLVDKYEKNMLSSRDDNPLLIRGWELIEEQYGKDEEAGIYHDPAYYRNLPFKDAKFEEEFGAYITARIKATGERWDDAVKDAIDDFELAVEEDRVGKKHSDDYLKRNVRGQVDDMLDEVREQLAIRDKEIADERKGMSWLERLGTPEADPEHPTNSRNSDPVFSDYFWAGTALEDAKTLIKAFDENSLSEGLTGFFSGAYRGLADKITDFRVWTSADKYYVNRLANAVNKFANGKPLTKSEKALVEAEALKLAVANLFKAVGHGYKAGQVTAESIPFMLEMAFNPASKSSNAISKGLEQYAKKNLKGYLKKILMKLAKTKAGKFLAKVAPRVVGDIGVGLRMAGTTGAEGVVTDAVRRSTPQLEYRVAPGNRIEASGVNASETDNFWEAALKALGARTIETSSELWGEYFSPLTKAMTRSTGKLLEKMHLGAINKWLSDLNSTEMARLVGDFRKQTRWDGSIAEYFEEVAGNVANALTVKDMNFALTDKNGKFSLKEENSVFNAQDNLDTFLGVSLMSGAMSTAKIVGYRTPRYRARQDVKRYGDDAKRIFGDMGHDWAAISSLIENESEESRRELVTHLMKSGKYSKAEKEVALRYAGALYKSRGIDLGEGKQKRSAGEQEASEAYGRGYNMATLENIAETSGVYNQLRAQMEKDYGSELMKRMDDEPGLVYNWVRTGAVSEEDAQKVLNYLNAKMAYDGAMDRLNDDDAAAKAAAEAHIDDRVHTEDNGGDGQIHPVALKGREGDFFVVSGNVTTDNEGNVDVNASDTDIVVVDNKGQRIMTHAKDIAQVGETIDAETAKADAVAKLDNVSEEVSGENEENLEDTESTENLEDTNLEKTDTTTGNGAAQGPLPVTEYNQDDLVTVEVDGKQVSGIITNGLDNDGNVTIYFDEPINGQQNWQMTPEQLNQVAVSYTSRDGETIDRSVREEESGESGENPQEPGAPSQVVSEEESGDNGETPQPQKQVNVEDFDVDNLDFENNYYVVHQTHEGNVQAILENGLNTINGLNGTALFANRETIKRALQDMREGHGHRGSTALVIMKFPKSEFGENVRNLDDLSIQLMESGKSSSFEVPTSFIENVVMVGGQHSATAQTADAAPSIQGQPQQAPAQPSLPVGEDGNADFGNATPQEAHDYIYNDPELDEDEANQAVQNKSRAAQQRLDQAQAVLDQAKEIPAPSMEDYGEDVAGYKLAKKQRNDAIAQAQAAVDAAQREVDLWNGVQAQHMMDRAAANAAANREETPAAPSAPVSGEREEESGKSENNTPVAEGQPSAPQSEDNGPMASSGPATREETVATDVEGELTPEERIEQAIAQRHDELMKQRAEELSQECGLPIVVMSSESDLNSLPTRLREEVDKMHAAGDEVQGFYDPKSRTVYLYLPDIHSVYELDRKFLHEAVAHGGLVELLGRDKFNQLCDQVWESMPMDVKERYLTYYRLTHGLATSDPRTGRVTQVINPETGEPYPITTAQKRGAADEFMAFMSEGGISQTLLDKIVAMVRRALRKVFKNIRLSNNDIVSLLRSSRSNLSNMDKVILQENIAETLEQGGEDEVGTSYSTTAIFGGAGVEVSETIKEEGKPDRVVPLTDKKGNMIARIGDKEFSVDNPVKAEDLKPAKMGRAVKESSVLHMLIEDSKKYSGLSDAQADKIYQNYADLLNMYLYMGSAEMGGPETVTEAWQWLGDSVFRTIAANGDAQYSYSMDIIRVCKKNEAVIKAMSALQLMEGRGATPSEIVDIYYRTYVEGYQVPCPVCYVFTRYIRNGKYASAAIKGMTEYGEHLPGGSDVWTAEQWAAELDRLNRATNPDYKPDGKSKLQGAEAEQAKRFKKQLDQANEITVKYEKRVNALSYELTDPKTSESRKQEILSELKVMDAQYKASVEVIAHQALTNWIKTHAIEEKDGKWVMRGDAQKPLDLEDYKRNALDLRLTSNTIANYPAIQRLRKSGGSAAGKEISFASDNELGEVVSGLGVSKTKLGDYPNVYQRALTASSERERRKFRKKARERFQDARLYALMQTLRGGQRMWSWSDNIERLSPDIALNIIQLELLGGAMQTYSKQLEGVKLAAQMGAYVNGSLMAKDNGWLEVKDSECYERDGELWLKEAKQDEVEEPQVGGGTKKRTRTIAGSGSHVYQAEDGKKYVLIYDDIVGIDPFGNHEIQVQKEDGTYESRQAKGLFALNAELDKAGNILVGMNDLHVRAAMADPAVFFIIPWHASGANNHILSEMLEILGQRMTDRLDYTAMQEEKNMGERNKDSKSLPEVNQRLRDLWEEGRQWAEENGWESGLDVDSNGDVLTESQYMYRKLRSLIFDGSIFEEMPSEEQYSKDVAEVRSYNARLQKIGDLLQDTSLTAEQRKVLTKEVGRIRPKRNKAQHRIDLHDGLIDWRDSSQHDGDAEWQEQHPKRINVEEARRMINNDEFLKQVLKRVKPIGKMTNGDNTYIYPYEYWDESSTLATADINGKRYVEFCRRMGYKPKFSGRWGDKVTEENMNEGNFVHDPGYWKLLIDRRMYDRAGKYQWLDPVNSEDFEPDLVNPAETKKEFHVTVVANDADAEKIADKTYETLSTRTPGGVARADYNKSLDEVMDDMDAALEQGSMFSVNNLVDENSEEEIKAMKKTVADFVSQDNLDKANGAIEGIEDKGLRHDAIFNTFDAIDPTLHAVNYIPEEFLKFIWGECQDNKVYCTVGHMIDHAIMHHPEMDAEWYPETIEIVTSPDRIVETYRSLDNLGGKVVRSVSFVKDINEKRSAVVLSLEQDENGNKVLKHKTFFGKYSPANKKGRRIYKNEPNLWDKDNGENPNLATMQITMPDGTTTTFSSLDEANANRMGAKKITNNSLMGGGTIISTDATASPRSNRLSPANESLVQDGKGTTKNENTKENSEKNSEKAEKNSETTDNGSGMMMSTSAMDREYMDAVEAGDMEKAGELVMRAAKIAMPNTKVVDVNGNPLIVYRASRWGKKTDYTVFDETKGGNDRGFYFTNKESAEKDYGGENVRAFFLNCENPDLSNNFNMLQAEKRYSEEMGYDGMIFAPYGNNDSTFEVKVFHPEQIKSAEPVTRDENGDVIPLSERFDFGNEDIRWSASYSLGVPYQGTKGRIARSLMEKLPSGRRFVDLFAGGGAMTHAALLSGKYDEYHMNDVNPVGVELFMQGVRGEWDDYNRTSMTPEEFKQIKGTPEAIPWSVLGLGRNLVKGGRPDYINRVKRLGQLKDQAGRISNSFEDYRNVEIRPGDVVYADIPYENTDTYNYGKGRKFDKKAFCDWAQGQDFPVFVSESVMPKGWVEIASESMKTINPKKNRVEKLWVQEKFADEYKNNTEQEPEVDGGLRFSVREKPEPKKTIPVYKLMRLGDDGKLYPLFIDGTEPIERGVWYDADSPNMDMLVDLPAGVHLIDTENGTSMTMEEYVKQNNIKLKKGQKYPPKEVIESTPNGQRWVYIEPTERGQRRFGGESRRYWNLGINGSGSVSTFSMRPGWHAGSLPTMRQIGKGAKKNLRDDRFVWVEGLISADIDYNEEAQGNPDNDIPTHIPTDGFYMKATNANAKASQADRVGWYISGAFMPVRIMSDSETRQVIDEWNQDHPDLQVEYDFPRESGKVFNAETMQLEDEAETRFSTSEAVATLKDDERVWNDLLGKVFSGVSNETRRGIVEDAMRNRGNDFGAATEAWLGGLADDGKFADVDRRDWGRVKLALHQALMDNGVDVSEPLSDGESRYVLWKAGQVDDGVFSLAEDVVMRDRLLSGAHAPQYTDSADVRFSTSAYDVIKAAREAASGEPQGNGYISSTYYHGEIAEGSNAGEKYTIRISDHPAKWDNFVYSEDEDLDGRVLSIVITDDLEYINEWKGRGLDEITDRDGYDVEQYILNADDVDTDMLTAAIENFKKTGRSYGMKDGEMIGIQESGDGIQFSVTPRDRAIARGQYERWMKSGRMQWVESMQDSMLGLKKLMQAIMGNNWTKIEDVAMYENPYIAENLMSSVTAAQQQAYYTEFMKPLLKEVSKLCKGGKKAREKAREELTNYLMAKHGLERNQVLADRDAQETAQAGGDYQEAYQENRERDYSGLTALTGEDDVHAAEAKAQQMVDDYESQHDTTELWNKINAATQVTLEKQYKSGMLSYAEYQRISDMFEYYVPLRGWEETTSDQVYGYLTSKAGPFLGGGIVKRAGGRTSKADDPIATIAQMGDDSIRTGNRNLMKQRFLNFVQNHPSDAVSVSDLWLKYDDVTDEWVPVFADIDPNDSPEVVEQKIQDFEQRMQDLANQEPDKYKHGREAANIPYRVIPGMEKEHQVLVKRNGQTWVLTINGNPRAAQALNGLTNPDVPMEGAWASMIKGAEWVNRTLSALYTTLSPAFIVSNFLRDTGYSNTMVWVRESPNYALRFNKNYLKLNPGTLRWLLGKWEDGTLDESKPLQKHFKEFMLNGGETGFAMVQDLEKYKKNMLNEVKGMNSKNFVKKGVKLLGSQYELLGRSIENCARFAAYMTSREMGRSAERAAYDAKEISVNFNKKGSGGKSLGKVGQTKTGNVGAFVSGMARSLYTFWNAGVQGMTNAGRAVKRHPVKAALLGVGPLYAAGFLAPVLAQLMGAGGDGDDDKNAYYNLPEYVRRSNLCIWLGDAWLTIPLPIEFRSIYGLGELTYGVISGNERYSDEELAMQVAGQFSQLLPIDMLEGGGGFHPFIPTLLKPIVEAEQNKSWSGLPIYRNSEWNKDDPEYTKAFSNANEWIVSGAEWLNAKTGGDEFKKGWLDLNPAKIEYMLKGYLGGIYTTIDEVRRAAETAFGKRDFEWRNIPLANRVIKQGDERTESKKLRDEYFKYKEDYENTKHLINKYKNAEDTDLFDYAKKLDLMNNSKEYGRYLIFEKYATMLDAYQKAKKGASGEVLKKIEEDEKALMRQLVDEMHAFEDGKLTIGDRPKLSKKDRSEDYGYMYNKLRTYVDINEDALLESALKRAKATDDKGLVSAINSIKRSISEMKKGLGRGKDEEVMNSIRQMRNSVLRSFGIIGGEDEETEPEEQWTEEPQEDSGDEGNADFDEPIEPYPDDEDDEYDY